MPFQANPNAGRADPQLIQMLFAQQRQRAQDARQDAQDQAAMQRQSALDAASEKRKERTAALSQASSLLDLQQKVAGITETMGYAEEAANLQMGAVQSEFPVSEYGQQAFAPQDERIAGLFPLAPQDDSNVSTQQGAADGIYQPVAALQAALANSLSGIPELADMQRSVPQMGRSAVARRDISEKPNLDWEYRGDGSKRRVLVGAGGQMTPIPGSVWVPPKAGVTVNVGGEGLDSNQVANASRAERTAFVTQMAPFEALDRALTTMKDVRGMADANGILPQQASQIIASDAMGALRPEALNEGDVARLTAVGLWNKAAAAIGLPPAMTVDQLDTLARMISDKARQAKPKRRALIEEANYRAKYFNFPPRLILGEYANSQAGKGKPKKPPGSAPLQPGVPVVPLSDDEALRLGY